MGMVLLTERYADRIRGVLTCFDRIIITGTLPDICHADAMAIHLRVKGVRLFDFARWAEPLRDEIRNHAERVAQDNGLQIEFVRKKSFRQDDRIKQILAQRGSAPGLVHVFSVLEPCLSFKPWHDKKTGRNFLRPDHAKCMSPPSSAASFEPAPPTRSGTTSAPESKAPASATRWVPPRSRCTTSSVS
jgi:hypothetical protein